MFCDLVDGCHFWYETNAKLWVTLYLKQEKKNHTVYQFNTKETIFLSIMSLKQEKYFLSFNLLDNFRQLSSM